MEDDSFVEIKSDYAFCCIYDGHGGSQAAAFCRENLHLNILAAEPFSRSEIEQALEEGFLRTDAELLMKQQELIALSVQPTNMCCGATAIVLLFTSPHDGTSEEFSLAWLGDCRAVLCRGGVPHILTTDHLINSEHERKRVLSEGGEIEGNRLSGFLEVSRALGDLDCQNGSKPAGLTAKPECLTQRITAEDEFIILGSDGLWDVMTEEDAVRFAREELRAYNDVVMASDKLVEVALKRHTDDNVTAMVVSLRPVPELEADVVRRRPRLMLHRNSNKQS